MAIRASLEELFYVLGGLVALWFAWRVLEWGWLSPQRLGRALRAQGLRGTAYRFPAGDLKEAGRQLAAERAKPMPLQSHGVSARVQPFVHNTVKEHGNISIIWIGPTPSVILHDPNLVREVLSNKFGHFKKAELPSRFMKLIGLGLANHEGDKWAVHRKIINHAFLLEKLKKMLPAFTTCTSELISRWEDAMGSGNKVQEIDVWPELQDLTGDAISRAAFGSSISEGRRIFRVQSEQIQLVLHMTNLYIPGYTFLPTKVNRRIKANAREVETLLKGIITKRERAMKNGQADDSDMLGLLLQSNARESQESGTSKPMMTMDDIIGELKQFYFAGMETTSVLLTWTMILLSTHPEWQDRAREEVLRIFGDKQPDLDGANQLKIVTMVLYEVLRLYPPITMLERETYKEMELGGVRYPAGVKLLLPIVTIHHDRALWGDDADEFRPERFAEGISKGVQGRAGVLPVRMGAKDLHRPELRAARSQDSAQHDPATLRVPAVSVLHARAVPRLYAAARAWGTDQPQENLISFSYSFMKYNFPSSKNQIKVSMHSRSADIWFGCGKQAVRDQSQDEASLYWFGPPGG